jgi:hypothetical protein
MLTEDEITEAVLAQAQEDQEVLRRALTQCGNKILKRAFLMSQLGLLGARSQSRVTLWEHRFDEHNASLAPLLWRAVQYGHARYLGIEDEEMNLRAEAKSHRTANHTLVEDAQAMLPSQYVIRPLIEGRTVSVVLSHASECSVQ